jgi:hypothetical protein
MPLKKKKRKAAVKRKAAKKKVIKRMVSKVTKGRPVKKAVKKAPLKKAKAKKAAPKKRKENILGEITHYFPKVRAAVIKLKAPLAAGDTIKVKGHTTDFKQAVASMQIDHVTITNAKKGDEIGLLVDSRVRRNDVVYKV